MKCSTLIQSSFQVLAYTTAFITIIILIFFFYLISVDVMAPLQIIGAQKSGNPIMKKRNLYFHWAILFVKIPLTILIISR